MMHKTSQEAIRVKKISLQDIALSLISHFLLILETVSFTTFHGLGPMHIIHFFPSK